MDEMRFPERCGCGADWVQGDNGGYEFGMSPRASWVCENGHRLAAVLREDDSIFWEGDPVQNKETLNFSEAFTMFSYFFPPFSPPINSINLELDGRWKAMHHSPHWQSPRKEFRRTIHTHPDFFPIILMVRFPPIHFDGEYELLITINNSVSALPHIKTMFDLKTLCQALGDKYE